jgi:hypothetical protein
MGFSACQARCTWYTIDPWPTFGGRTYRLPMLNAPGLRGLGHTGGRV